MNLDSIFNSRASYTEIAAATENTMRENSHDCFGFEFLSRIGIIRGNKFIQGSLSSLSKEFAMVIRNDSLPMSFFETILEPDALIDWEYKDQYQISQKKKKCALS